MPGNHHFCAVDKIEIELPKKAAWASHRDICSHDTNDPLKVQSTQIFVAIVSNLS